MKYKMLTLNSIINALDNYRGKCLIKIDGVQDKPNRSVYLNPSKYDEETNTFKVKLSSTVDHCVKVLHLSDKLADIEDQTARLVITDNDNEYYVYKICKHPNGYDVNLHVGLALRNDEGNIWGLAMEIVNE